MHLSAAAFECKSQQLTAAQAYTSPYGARGTVWLLDFFAFLLLSCEYSKIKRGICLIYFMIHNQEKGNKLHRQVEKKII